MKMKPSIQLVDGSYFRFDDLDTMSEDMGELTHHIVAHALSNTCRFTGHCVEFYSVAQHSVLCSQLVEAPWAYEALMHDGHEALMGDMSAPLKVALPAYHRLETLVAGVFRERFDLMPDMSAEVKTADMVMLATEQRDLMPDGEQWPWLTAHGIDPSDALSIECWAPSEAYRRFMARLEEVRP